MSEVIAVGEDFMRNFITCTFLQIYVSYHVKEGETDRNVAHIGKKRNAYRILVRKPEGKRPL
jgi:hypothetical protein